MSKELWWSRRKEDFRIEWFSGTGSGGQHRNKHQNCVKLFDKETGIMTIGQSQRSQKQNLKDAFQKMVKLLQEHYESLEKKEEAKRSTDKEIATRTYHESDNRVTDHVTGKSYSYKHTVGKGDIEEIVNDRFLHMIGKKNETI